MLVVLLPPLLLSLLSLVAAAPSARSWSLLYANGSFSPGTRQQCLDAVGGAGPVVDTYGCVDPHATNAQNELFNLTADGELLVQSDPTGGCVVASPCSGHTSGLCLSSCGAAASRWLQRELSDGMVTLSPAAQPRGCLTFEGNLTSKLTVRACVAGDASQRFTWGAFVPPAPPPPPLDLPIDLGAFDPLLPFEGLGALSAGADAALLFDYEDDVRGRILDLLFLPHFPGGASLQILKGMYARSNLKTHSIQPVFSLLLQ